MSTASKKSSSKAAANTKYDVRDIVLGKVRGFQPWPGMVIDPENVPDDVASERPNNKKTTFYCVKFFPKGDHAWLAAKDMSRLQTHEIQTYLSEPPSKKTAELLEGYRIAADPRKWEEEQAARAAAAAEEAANAEVDQLEDVASEEDDDGSVDSKPAKKRKRVSEARSKKAAGGSAEPSSKKKGGASKSAKKNGKSKAMVESEDDGDRADADGEPDDGSGELSGKQLTSPPPTKKTKRDKDDGPFANDPEAQKVKNWRHTLQKTFLSDNKIIKAEDTPTSDLLFTDIEQYDAMTVAYLTFSKIGKVMRHIHLLDESKIPNEAQYNFRKRAKALVDRWHNIVADGKATTNGNAAAAEPASAKQADKEGSTAPAAGQEDVEMKDATNAAEPVAAAPTTEATAIEASA